MILHYVIAAAFLLQWWGAEIQPKHREGRATVQTAHPAGAAAGESLPLDTASAATEEAETAAVDDEASDEHVYSLNYDADADFPSEMCNVAFISEREC